MGKGRKKEENKERKKGQTGNEKKEEENEEEEGNEEKERRRGQNILKNHRVTVITLWLITLIDMIVDMIYVKIRNWKAKKHCEENIISWKIEWT